MNLTSPKDITAFLKENGLSPLKKFGQNFLADQNITDKIAGGVSLPPSGCVLEIGTGLGALTAALSARAKRVLSVEIDKGLLAAYQTTLAPYKNVTVVEGDILKTDIRELCDTYFGGQPFAICGNLPYYITSKILLHVLESGAPVTSLTVMLQKEVAQRLCANEGDTDYGALTASCRYYADPQILFTVSKHCFYPAPDVDSAIVALNLSRAPLPAKREDYVKTVRTAFSMRRKTLLNNLKQVADEADAKNVLETYGIPLSIRAQDVSPSQFSLLAQALFGEK